MGLLGKLTGKLPGMGGSNKPAYPAGKGLLGKAASKVPMPGRKMVKTGVNGVDTSSESSAAMTE